MKALSKMLNNQLLILILIFPAYPYIIIVESLHSEAALPVFKLKLYYYFCNIRLPGDSLLPIIHMRIHVFTSLDNSIYCLFMELRHQLVLLILLSMSLNLSFTISVSFSLSAASKIFSDIPSKSLILSPTISNLLSNHLILF